MRFFLSILRRRRGREGHEGAKGRCWMLDTRFWILVTGRLVRDKKRKFLHFCFGVVECG